MYDSKRTNHYPWAKQASTVLLFLCSPVPPVLLTLFSAVPPIPISFLPCSLRSPVPSVYLVPLFPWSHDPMIPLFHDIPVLLFLLFPCSPLTLFTLKRLCLSSLICLNKKKALKREGKRRTSPWYLLFPFPCQCLSRTSTEKERGLGWRIFNSEVLGSRHSPYTIRIFFPDWPKLNLLR